MHDDLKNSPEGVVAPIVEISRLRENMDGPGIRTLVAFNDCQLNCKYCLNKKLIRNPLVYTMSTKQLYSRLEKDSVYMEMTKGGVTFGGGEPLLYIEFIHEFKKDYPMYSIAMETSLNVDYVSFMKIYKDIDYWYIDIKDMDPQIYYDYTGVDNQYVLNNLKFLINHVNVERIICRVPHIPNYNNDSNVQNSVKLLKQIGVQYIDEFEYKV